ncbi:MAG: PepSY-associated TM helix domain-containing protein [Alphaproteobacteria bacterium]
MTNTSKKAAFYRLCRTWHGYLSAVAFVWLLFFSITGILLNHPAWLRGVPATVNRPFHLQPQELASITAQREPGQALVGVLRGPLGLRGEIDNADMAGSQLFVRMRGASGSSDLQLDLRGGQGSAVVETFPPATLFKELHRGEKAGGTWRALIDISGGALVVTSILGLAIYFSLRFRLRTTLILIAGGLAVMAAAVLLVVR